MAVEQVWAEVRYSLTKEAPGSVPLVGGEPPSGVTPVEVAVVVQFVRLTAASVPRGVRSLA